MNSTMNNQLILTNAAIYKTIQIKLLLKTTINLAKEINAKKLTHYQVYS